MNSSQNPSEEDPGQDHALAQRLREARKRLGHTQQRMGRAIGGTLRAWQEYEAGRRRPRQEALAGLARLGVNINWVLIGEGPMWSNELGEASREVIPPLLPQEHADEPASTAPVGFDPEWLRQRFGVAPERTALLTVRGDALAPTLQPGDVVLLDRSVQQI